MMQVDKKNMFEENQNQQQQRPRQSKNFFDLKLNIEQQQHN